MPFLTHFGHFQGPTGNVLTEKLPVDAYAGWGVFGAKRLPLQRRDRAGYLHQQIRKGEKVAGRNKVKAA